MSKVFELHNKKVFVAGHKGLVGKALLKVLSKYSVDLITVDKNELDLREQAFVRQFIGDHKPDLVLLASAKVGGIEANRTQPVDFLYDNLMISTNVIHASANADVTRLMNLSSNCYYPRLASQPLREDSLLTGPFEPTNEAYAIAKLAATKLTQYYAKQHNLKYFTLVPTSLFGPGDHFNDERGHVIPALINRFHQAKINELSVVTMWGSGSPTREFLYIEDAAEAMLYFTEYYNAIEPVNLAGGQTISIKDLGLLIAEIVGYKGRIEWNTNKPDGMPHKALDSEKCFEFSWRPKVSFAEGIKNTYQDYLNQC